MFGPDGKYGTWVYWLGRAVYWRAMAAHVGPQSEALYREYLNTARLATKTAGKRVGPKLP